MRLTHPDTAKLILSIEKHFSIHIDSIENVAGGLVHYVYKVTTIDGTVSYVKIRKDHYASLPTITTDPEQIKYEHKALTILSQYFPTVFPTILGFASEEHMLHLSDIMPHRQTLENKLNKQLVSEEILYNLGKLIAEIHAKLADVKETIREDGDKAYYCQLQYYRFGYHNHPVLTKLITQMDRLPKQLILGDLSPKNIGVSPNGYITICDLENCHWGNTLSDVGFLASSIVLHTIPKKKCAERLLHAYIHGYGSVNPIKDELVLKKIILGIALYRLDNPVIPYRVALTHVQRIKVIEKIKQLLQRTHFSYEEIIATFYEY